MKAHYEQILRDTDKRAGHALRIQFLREDSPYFGGFPMADGYAQAKHAMYSIGWLAACYCNEGSKFYQDETVLERIRLGCDYVDRNQHENGLFDYVTCNFFSAPDTAFYILAWIPHLQFLMKKEKRTQGEEYLMQRLQKVVHLGARGLLEGGFHTPNHRWAIASVLAFCGKLFHDGQLADAANIYLNEGIDCNADGEYAEKSAGNYNRVNNDAMMMLSQALETPEYDRHAIRNLRMMLTYQEPDGSIFTANSTRFDKDRLVFPDGYYFEYLSLGYRYDIPEFLAMANHIMDIAGERNLPAPDFLMDLMLHPELIDCEYAPSGALKEYRALYQDSAIARVRRDSYTYTVLGGKSNFLYVHNGSLKMAMKIGGSFCEHRAFKAERLTEENGEFHLRQTMRGWYYLPFEEKPATSDWWKMDNASRKKKLGPDMDIHVIVREVGEGIEVELDTAGVTGAPWRVELAFSGINRISTPHMTMPIRGDEALALKDSDFEVSNGWSAMTIGPAFGFHHFTEGKEDSEGKAAGAATVYLTDYTPFRHVLTIKP